MILSTYLVTLASAIVFACFKETNQPN
jgi:hypothetical protein